MWKKLKHLAINVQTYADLSPSLAARRQVNQRLRHRSAANVHEWFNQFWEPLGVAKPLCTFIYTRFSDYSGINFARVYPSDYLEVDLQFSLVCWFDWEINFCEDFCAEFGIDVSERLEAFDYLNTVADWVIFLNQLLLRDAER